MTNEKVLSALHRTREAIDKMDWSLDGLNDKQNYQFLSHRKMKANMNKALIAANAEFMISYENYEEKEAVGMMKQHYIVCATGMFFDVASGEYLTFRAYGEAADSGDKGLGKAQTNAYKTLIAQTFQISELNEDGEGILASNDSIKSEAENIREANKEIMQKKVIKQNAVKDAPKESAKEETKAVPKENTKKVEISDTQRKILEKIIFKAKTLSEEVLAKFGGIMHIEEDYSGVKTADDALAFITAYQDVLRCQ